MKQADRSVKVGRDMDLGGWGLEVKVKTCEWDTGSVDTCR